MKNMFLQGGCNYTTPWGIKGEKPSRHLKVGTWSKIYCFCPSLVNKKDHEVGGKKPRKLSPHDF